MHVLLILPFTHTHALTKNNYPPLPCLPFPGVRTWVVTSPVVLQRAGAVPNMDFLLFPRSFPLPEPAGDSVERPWFPHTTSKQKREWRVVSNDVQTDWRPHNKDDDQ